MSCQIGFRENSGRGVIETVFSIVLIIVISGIFVGRWLVYLRDAREVSLESQLTNLKYSLELYKILEGRYPEDLRELNKRCIKLKEDSLYGRRYLELQTEDEEGYPVDVYGRRFIYYSGTGKIERGRGRNGE